MSALVLLLTLLLVAAAARGNPLLTLSVLVGSTLLLPATLLVPHSPTGILTVSRLVEAAAVVGVLVARRSGPPARGTSAPPVLFLLLGYLAVSAVTGVALADPLTDPVQAAYGWVGIAEEAVVLLIALELGRRVEASRVLLVLVAAAGAAAAVGIGEAIVHASWARTFFAAVPAQLSSGPASKLESRAGGLRVRGAADFALAYGWTLAALVPALAAGALAARRSRRLSSTVVALLVTPLVVAAVVLTRGRSPLLGLLLVAVVLWFVLAPRRPSVLLLGVAAVLVGLTALAPELRHALAPSVDAGSIDVRVQRLPGVLALGAARPLQGVGITGIQRLGLGGVDSSWILVYVESGILAVTLLVGAALAGVAGVLRGLRGAGDGNDRLLVIACGLGMMTLLAGAAAFDVFTVLTTERLFWLLGGLGIAAADRRCGPQRLPSPAQLLSPLRVGALLLLVAIGVGLHLLVPHHTRVEAVFATLDVRTESLDDPPGMGRTLVTSTCQAGRELAQPGHSWRLAECAETSPPGWGRLAVVAPDAATASAGLTAFYTAAHAVPGLQSLRVGPAAEGPVSGLPTAARVAPEVLALAGLLLLLLVPERQPATGDG